VTHWDPISITCTTPDAEIYYRLDINYDEAWIVDDEVCVCGCVCVCVCVCVVNAPVLCVHVLCISLNIHIFIKKRTKIYINSDEAWIVDDEVCVCVWMCVCVCVCACACVCV